jgi:uncharacterized repeat protein (TIGR02543 family)
MKKTKLGKVIALLLAVILLAGLLPVIALAVDPTDSDSDGYNDNDLNKLKAFLNIEDATTHKTNLKKISDTAQIDNPATWPGVTWTTDAIKSIQAINILPGKGLTGVLDLSDAVKLEFLDCWENELTGLNLSGAVSLQTVDCHYNQLSAINLTGTSALKVLFCMNNKLSSFNCSYSTAITGMSCANNPLKTLRANLLGRDIVVSSTSAGTVGATLTGNNLQLKASPVADEAHFANWTEGATVLSAAKDYTIDLSQSTPGTSLNIVGNFSHLVSFITNQSPLTQIDKYVDDGGLVSPPADPTRAGYAFGGWYTVNGQLSLISPFDFDTPIHESILLAAKWNKLFSVSSSATGGSITPSKPTAITGDTINLTITPDAGKQLKAGTLKYHDSADHTITGTSFTMPAANVTVSAEFVDGSAPVITSANHTSIPSKGGTFQVTATGTAPLAYSLTGAPDGVSINPSTGLITMDAACHMYMGTNKSFTVTVSNGTAPDVTQDFTLTILDTPYIVTAGLTKGTVGVAYNCAPDALGGGTINWVLSGTLPEGLNISGSTISGTPTTAGNYTLTFTATNANGSDTATYTLTIDPAPTVYTGGGTGSPGTETPQVNTTTTGSGSNGVTTVGAEVTGTTSGGSQTVAVPMDIITGLTDAAEKAERTGGIAIASIDTGAATGLSKVGVTIPGASFHEFAAGTKAALQINSSLGSVTFSAGAVDKIGAAGSGDVTFGIGTVDKASLSADKQKLVGSRPVFSFSVNVGDTKVSEFGSSVTVTLPYTLGAKENPNAIVVYYIDASGALKTMRGKYNTKTGTVTFKTTHFSEYTIGYNKVSLNDISDTAWYADAVTFITARGIATGTGGGNFSPEANLTRGQFLVMVMNAYGIAADESPKDNFSDAGNTYYTGFLAAAKRLGITRGVGNNMFAPENEITRQEMFTLLYNTLKQLDELPTATTGKALTEFSDADGIALWAKDAVALLVGSGTITGSGEKLSPTGTTTRAEMARVLYNLLSVSGEN